VLILLLITSFRTRFGTFTEVLTLFPSVYSTTFAPSITEVFFAGTCSVTKTEFAFTPSGIVTLKPKFSSDFFASVNVLLITSGTFAVLAEATPALVVLEFSDAIPMYGSTSVNMFDKIGAAILLPYGFSVAGLYTTTSPTNLGSSAGAIAVYCDPDICKSGCDESSAAAGAGRRKACIPVRGGRKTQARPAGEGRVCSSGRDCMPDDIDGICDVQ